MRSDLLRTEAQRRSAKIQVLNEASPALTLSGYVDSMKRFMADWKAHCDAMTRDCSLDAATTAVSRDGGKITLTPNGKSPEELMKDLHDAMRMGQKVGLTVEQGRFESKRFKPGVQVREDYGLASTGRIPRQGRAGGIMHQYNSYCPTCEGSGRWGITREKCMECQGTGKPGGAQKRIL
jgi:hypothetical protein